VSFEEVCSLAARRGFFWNAYEIYGGVRGFLTWGPLGTILKRKISNLWREMFVYKHGFVEIDSPAIAPYIVFKASGHVDHFKDSMVSCLSCDRKYKADQLLEEYGIKGAEGLSLDELARLIEEEDVRCPECGGKLGKPTYFTTMFKTVIGPYSKNEGFFRPETAQGMFTEFKRVYTIAREMFPIGIAQVGRGFRNEISPRQGPIRLREFDMMELELFYDPKNPTCPYLSEVEDLKINLLPAEEIRKGEEKALRIAVKEALERKYIYSEWLAYFMALAQIFISKLGIPVDRQRFREKLPEERAHYARQTFDQEVLLSRWGWIEVSGHADRTDYDLSSHMRESREDLTVKRRLAKPIIVEKKLVKPNVKEIKRSFKDASNVLRELSKRSVDEILKELEEKGYIEVLNHKLDSKFFEVEVKKEKKIFESFVPYVAEPSFGLDRVCYSTLEYALRKKDERLILSLPPYIAPIEAAVFPIVAKQEFIEIASAIRDALINEGYKVIFETKESIGKRYARVDEIGVPVAFTVDGKTLEDKTVTARDRDSWRQFRIKMERCADFVKLLIKTGSFDEALRKL